MAYTPLNLANKRIIVTGGASGLGLAVVHSLASSIHPPHIAVLDLSPSTPLISSLKTTYPSATFFFHTCDISSWEQQATAFAAVEKEFGGIDIVFANAGISEVGKFLEREVDEGGGPRKPELKTVQVDLIGTLYSIKLAVHYMRKNEGKQKGSIICTASNAGLYPFSVAPMYGTAKHGVVGAVRSLAKPLLEEGIRINAICPNVVKTNIAEGKLFEKMELTPIELVVQAVRDFIADPDITGATAEISGEKITMRESPEYVDDATRKNMDAFWSLGYA